MKSRKRNEFLDADSSEEDGGSGYDSEAQDTKGGRGTLKPSFHPAKRRRGSTVAEPHTEDEEYNSDKEEEQEEPDDEDKEQSRNVEGPATTTGSSSKPTIAQDSTKASLSSSPLNPKKALKPITSKSAEATNARLARTGILYISRIPPYLSPHALRSFLEPHAPKGLSRIFLTPEPASNRRLRISNNGNKKASFTDGWVEFVSKKDAKIAAELLNTKTFGGRGWWKDDVWNVRYLKAYKWSDLMEQIRAEEREREARLMVGIAKGRKEEKAFIKQVEQAKVEKTKMERKKRAKSGHGPGPDEQIQGDGHTQREKRTFRQNEVRGRQGQDLGIADQPEQVKRVLSKIF